MFGGRCVDAVLRAGGSQAVAAQRREADRAMLGAIHAFGARVAARSTPGIPALKGGSATAEGFARLPAGIHEAGWGEFMRRFATSPERRALAETGHAALLDARSAGIETAIVGGSFPSGKRVPGDLDIAVIANRGGNQVPNDVVNRYWDRGVRMYHAHQTVMDRARFNPPLPTGHTMLDLLRHDREQQPFGVVAIQLSTL